MIISCNLLSFFFFPIFNRDKEIARFDRTPNASIIANVQRHTARGNLVAQSSSKVPSQFWYRLQQSILKVVDVWQGNKNHCFRCYYLFLFPFVEFFKFLSTGWNFILFIYFIFFSIEITIYREAKNISLHSPVKVKRSLIWHMLLFSFFFSLYFLAILPVFYQIPVFRVQN